MSKETPSRGEQIRELLNGSARLSNRRADLLAIGLLAVLAIVLPYVAEVLMGFSGVASNILVWMLFAVAFNLLLGYAGLLSFGHAMFLGGGMYFVAIIMTQVGQGLFFIAAPLAPVALGVLAYFIGRLIANKGEIYFALLTIAFGEILWYIVNADPGGITGGDDGIARGLLPPFVEASRGELNIVLGGLEVAMYWAIATVFVASVYLLYRIVRSPFGRTLLTIRENEELARSIGVDTYRYKVHTFVLSAAFSAIAGVLLVIVNTNVATRFLFWETSGQVVMMTIIGGISSFAGPMFGAFLWFFGEEFLSGLRAIGDLRHFWQFGFGLLFVVIILVSPKGGAWGMIKDAGRWIGNKVLGGN